MHTFRHLEQAHISVLILNHMPSQDQQISSGGLSVLLGTFPRAVPYSTFSTNTLMYSSSFSFFHRVFLTFAVLRYFPVRKIVAQRASLLCFALLLLLLAVSCSPVSFLFLPPAGNLIHMGAHSRFFLVTYVEEGPWWPMQSLSNGRKNKVKG